MKSLRIIISITAIALMLFACSKNDHEIDDKPQKEYNEETALDDLTEEVKDLMEDNKDIAYEEIQKKIKDNPLIESSIVEDNMLYITMTDGMELQVDLYGVSRLQETDEELDNGEVDNLVEEINNTLKIEDDEEDDNNNVQERNDNNIITESNIKEDKSMSAPQKAATNLTERVITNKNVLLWAPNPPKETLVTMQYSFSEFAKKNGLKPKILIGDECKLSDINSFSNYGLVFIATHGNTKGQLCMPSNDYWIKQLQDNQKSKLLYGKNYNDNGVSGKLLGFDKNHNAVYEDVTLSPRFPKLNETIIWTCVCHAFNSGSQILTAAKSADCAGFGGADHQIGFDFSYLFLNRVAARFYNAGKGGTDLQKSYKYGWWEFWRDYDYSFTNKEGHVYSGTYQLFTPTNNTVIYQYPSAIEPKKNKPRGEIYNSAGQNPFNGRRIKSYSQTVSLSQIEAGFLFYNKKTGEKQLVPYSNNDKVRSATWSDLITRYVITGNTDNLEEGEYKYKTYIKLGDEIIYSDQEYEFKVDKSLCPDNNHPHAIDLGIGVKFACCNVGASAPWEYGGYYAWGETAEKSYYSYSTYKYFDNAAYQNGKDWYYCFINIGSDIAGTQYDVAHVKWGGKWKMPTYEQLRKLIDNCTSTWTQVNGINGITFVGSNGNSIFLPAAGGRYDDQVDSAGGCGYYWSSTQDPNGSIGAYYLDYGSNAGVSNYYRYYGHTVRPVTE